MAFHVIIPARYASTRLPGKPLAEIAGKPMVPHVYERARLSGAQSVVVATDDSRIYEVLTKAQAEVVMTREDHQSGTDRLSEAAEILGLQSDDIVVNVQGDEPEIPVPLIHQVALALEDCPSAQMSTACSALDSLEQLQDQNVVKVVRDSQDLALYFSRAPIFWSSGETLSEHRRHIGIYGYRANFLKTFTQLAPCQLERAEKLEQLRALWHGYSIVCPDAVEVPPPGVDSEKDLEETRRRMA